MILTAVELRIRKQLYKMAAIFVGQRDSLVNAKRCLERSRDLDRYTASGRRSTGRHSLQLASVGTGKTGRSMRVLLVSQPESVKYNIE